MFFGEAPEARNGEGIGSHWGKFDRVDDSFTLNLDISVNVKLLARAVETSGVVLHSNDNGL
jgi:hypothetical protein